MKMNSGMMIINSFKKESRRINTSRNGNDSDKTQNDWINKMIKN